MFAFTSPRVRRRPSLTPMIDVVFLLLVFFMIAARFGQDAFVPIATAGSGSADWQGPPRLIEVFSDEIRLNGVAASAETLPATLSPLMPTPDAPVVLRADETVGLQPLLDLIAGLRGAGFSNLVLVE